jgi:hypothetical protein
LFFTFSPDACSVVTNTVNLPDTSKFKERIQTTSFDNSTNLDRNRAESTVSHSSIRLRSESQSERSDRESRAMRSAADLSDKLQHTRLRHSHLSHYEILSLPVSCEVAKCSSLENGFRVERRARSLKIVRRRSDTEKRLRKE